MLLLRSLLPLLLSLSPLLLLGLASAEEAVIDNPQKYYIPGASGSGPFETLKDWIAAFEAKYPEADLSVSSVGSGAAQSALWGDVDCEKKPVEGVCGDGATRNETFWGMGGATFSSEAYDEHSSLGLQQLPALGGAILITYSKDVTGDLGAQTSKQLNMSFGTVAGIFNNSIVRWNDPAIQADNPSLDLPSDRITVVVRSDKSGMSQTLTEAIRHANPTTWPEDGVGKTPNWPLNNLTASTESGVCTSNEASDDVPLNFKADGQTGIGISLLRQPSSMGYLEPGYFSTLTQFVAQAHVSSPAHPESFVPATEETLQTTMGGLANRLEPDSLSLTLSDQDTPLGGYPISRYVYWYIKKDAREYQSCYQAWLLYTFIEWTYTDPLAREIALGNGWVVPPTSVVDKALAKLQEMQCLDVPSSPDATPNLLWVADYTPLPYQESEDDTSFTLAAILIPTAIVAFLIFSAVAGYVYIEHKKRQADAVWIVKKSELEFGGSEQMIGVGTFGLVLLAEYRGTKVAVKSVLPPESKMHHHSKASSQEEEDPEQASISNPGLETDRRNISRKSMSLIFANSGNGFLTRRREHRKMRADFILEMRQLNKLRHPNITTTMGAVLAPGEEPMLIMEYMHNGSLYDAIRDQTINLNSHEDILTMIQDVAHGLRYLHSADPQVIHGDLKSKNVLIDANGRAKVADFGLSAKSKLKARGTPYFMAPELLSGESTNTPMSDVYAFGMLLYEAYARKSPYEGEDYKEVLRLVCDPTICKRPPVPSLCPPKVAGLLQDCLQHNPNDRPTAKDIDALLQAEGTVQGRVIRIAALNKELADSNERISSEQATQLGHFASMSHEIRTPLNCIIGISSLLEEDNNLDAAQRDSVKMIVASGKLLKHVVDDVLDFSKFISGNAEIDIKRTNLQDTMTNIITSMMLSPVTERKRISIRTFFDPLLPQYVETDDRRLQQIMYNLLSNAVKFSKEKSNVDLSVSVGHRFDNIGDDQIEASLTPNQRPALRICVKDYGKGIDESEFEKIFQPFAQTESGIANVDGGTGLGLAITKQLVEALGGSISVDSRVGEWTMFSMQFPLTVSEVDKTAIESRLKGCGVCLVSNQESEVHCVTSTCDYFNVKHRRCGSMKELGEQLESSSPLRKQICLIQDSLYDESAYEIISQKTKTVLVSFGPEGKIKRAQAHYQSLELVFPSVMMQEFDSLCNLHRPVRRLVSRKFEEGRDIVTFEGLNILVAEDNKVNQKVIKRLLERLGITKVQIAENGQVAVDREAAECFDVVFMDIQMPVMGGIEACKRIVARSSKTPPKVVFLSAHVMDDYQSMCLENGATDYMTKPITLEDLRRKLEQLMNMPYGGRSSAA